MLSYLKNLVTPKKTTTTAQPTFPTVSTSSKMASSAPMIPGINGVQAPAPLPVKQPVSTSPIMAATAPKIPGINGVPYPAPQQSQTQIDATRQNQLLGQVLGQAQGVSTAKQPVPIQSAVQPGAPSPGAQQAGGLPQNSLYSQVDASMRQMQEQMALAQAEAQRQREAQRQALEFLQSPEAFNEMFSRVMGLYNPMLDQQNAQIQRMIGDAKGGVDVDAERRGLYNSGIPVAERGRLDELQASEMSKALAEMQARATGDVRGFQDQQMQAIQMQGDWTDRDRNAQFEQFNTQMQSQMAAARFGLDEQQLYEQIRQFDTTMDFEKAKHQDELSMFSQKMGLEWGKLAVDEKIGLANVKLRALEVDMQQEKFKTEKEMMQAEQRKDQMMDTMQAYQYIQTAKNDKVNIDVLKQSYSIYKEYMPSVYNDLIKTIDQVYGKTSTTSASSNYPAGASTPGVNAVGYTGSNLSRNGADYNLISQGWASQFK